MIEAVILKNRAVNRAIPDMDPDTLRLVHYDANMFANLHGYANNIEHIRSDLERLQPTVVAFTRVPKQGEALRDTFDRMLRRAGFVHRHYFHAREGAVGNMIASRLPLQDRGEVPLGGIHTAVLASIEVQPFRLTLVAATVDTSSPILPTPEQKGLLRNYLLAGRKSSLVKPRLVMFGNIDASILASNDSTSPTVSVKNAFEVLSWRKPYWTGLSGTVEDYILCSPTAETDLTGAYIYLTTGTAQMPLLVDYHAPGVEEAMVPMKLAMAQNWLFYVSVTFILTITVVGMYYWIRSKLYDY